MGNLDLEPGKYDADGAAMALIEQQRANTIDKLRTTKAASVTMLDDEGGAIHWGIYLKDDEAPEAFLPYAAVRAVRDLAAALDATPEHTCVLVLAAIREGAGD